MVSREPRHIWLCWRCSRTSSTKEANAQQITHKSDCSQLGHCPKSPKHTHAHTTNGTQWQTSPLHGLHVTASTEPQKYQHSYDFEWVLLGSSAVDRKCVSTPRVQPMECKMCSHQKPSQLSIIVQRQIANEKEHFAAPTSARAEISARRHTANTILRYRSVWKSAAQTTANQTTMNDSICWRMASDNSRTGQPQTCFYFNQQLRVVFMSELISSICFELSSVRKQHKRPWK